MGHRKTNRYNGGRGTQGRMAEALDDVAEYEEFKREILPKLRKMMREGKSAEDIYAFSQSLLAARAVSIGASSQDEKTALAAIKEVLDRGVGKPSETLTVTNRYEKLSDDVLDKMLEQQEAQLANQQDEDVQSH